MSPQAQAIVTLVEQLSAADQVALHDLLGNRLVVPVKTFEERRKEAEEKRREMVIEYAHRINDHTPSPK